MTTETVTVRETAHFFTREPRSSFAAVLRETALLDDICTVVPGAKVRDTFYASDAYEQSAFSVLHDTVHAADNAYPNLTYYVTTRDVFRASDDTSWLNHAHVNAHETLVVHGTAKAPPSASLYEKARLDDAIHWFSSGFGALHETFRVRDAVYPHTSVVLREVVHADDALSSHLHSVIVLHERAQFDDVVFPHRIARSGLHEVFRVKDWATPIVIYRGGFALHEEFYADDRAMPPPNGRAYTAHIVNWGMSTYANYPFLTQARNFAAGQNLWRLDAVDDYGTPIASWITTGKLDIGTSHGKRPSAIYAAGSSLEPLTIVVTGDVNGALAEFTYTLNLRDQTNYRNNRAFLGKGFRSRYLQFKLSTVKYVNMHLLNAEVDVSVSPRRVG